jgi:hypothetical protein
MGPVEALDAALAQHLAAVQRAAFGCPPGGGPEWDGILRHYGHAALDQQERTMIVQCMRLSRGAVPAEFRMVIVGLQGWAQGQLEQLRANGGATSHAFAHVQQRVATLVDREVEAYERALGIAPSAPAAPPPMAPAAPAGPSLASIFANAQQTSKEVPWTGVKYKTGPSSLNCVHCGGPQEQPQDFMCKYCRRPIAGSIKPTA